MMLLAVVPMWLTCVSGWATWLAFHLMTGGFHRLTHFPATGAGAHHHEEIIK